MSLNKLNMRRKSNTQLLKTKKIKKILYFVLKAYLTMYRPKCIKDNAHMKIVLHDEVNATAIDFCGMCNCYMEKKNLF